MPDGSGPVDARDEERLPRRTAAREHDDAGERGLSNGVTAYIPPIEIIRREPAQVDWPPPLRRPLFIGTGRGPVLGLRAAVAAVSAIVLLAGIGYAVFAATRTPPLTSLAAQVASMGQVDLGFPSAGILSAVDVHAGQRVSAGRVLATETVPGLGQQVTADKEAVTTDQSDISALNALLASTSQELAADNASQQQNAASGVSSAAQAISSTSSARQQTIQAFQNEVAVAQNQLTSDQQTYATQCNSSPNGTGSNATVCAALAHEVVADQLGLASAQASLSAQEQAQAEWTAAANRTLQDSQAAQQGLVNDTSLELVPLEVDLQNARSQLARDQAQLATDKAKAADTSLIAPAAGTVVSVSGSVGEVVSGTGVSSASFSGGSVAVTPGFQLFPSQQSSAGSSQGVLPVAVLQVGGPLLVNVMVPESQIGLVRVGDRVTIAPKVAGPRPLRGVVSQIFPNSTVAAGVVSYEVQVRVDNRGGRAGWLPGMTATADIGR